MADSTAGLAAGQRFAMCNRCGYLSPVSRLVDAFRAIRIAIIYSDGAIPNIEPCEHIRPINSAPIIPPLDPAHPAGGVELVDARWRLIPFIHKGAVKDWKPM